METTQESTSTPRPVLYARFPRSFGFEFVLIIFLTPPLVVLWGFVAYYYYLNGAISLPILKVAVYYLAGYILALVLYGNHRAARRGSGIILDGERIVWKRGGALKVLACADIRGIGYSKNPLFNKKMIVDMEVVGRVTLPINISGGYRMVERIFKKLAVVGSFNKNEKKAGTALRHLYITAMRYDALYKLRERYIDSFSAVLAVSAIFNGTVAALYWERRLATVLAWGFAGMLFQTLGYLAAERLWTVKMFGRIWMGGNKGVNTTNVGIDTANFDVNTVDTGINTAGAGVDTAVFDISTVGTNIDTADISTDTVDRGVNNDDDYALFKTLRTAAAVIALLVGMIAGIAVTQPAL